MKQITLDQHCPESWRNCNHYDQVEVFGPYSHLGHFYGYNNRRRHTLELIQTVAAPGAKILDVAAAQGNFSIWLAELGYEVTWNDLRSDLVEYVQLKQDSGIIHFAPGNLFSLGFDGQFDIVLIAEIIEHVAHPDEFLQKVSQLVKPGGHIIMTTPNGEYFRNRLPRFSNCEDPSVFERLQFKPDSDGHIFLLHIDEVYSLSQSVGLSTINLKLFNNFLTIGHFKSNFFLKFLPRTLVQMIEHLTQLLPLFLAKKLNYGMAVVLHRTV